jgi:hypothetical protein
MIFFFILLQWHILSDIDLNCFDLKEGKDGRGRRIMKVYVTNEGISH